MLRTGRGLFLRTVPLSVTGMESSVKFTMIYTWPQKALYAKFSKEIYV